MILGNSYAVASDGSLGFSITSPFKSVAHAAKAVGRGTVAVGKGVEHGTVAAAKGAGGLVSKYGKQAALLAALPVVEVNKIIVEPALKATILRPVISRINTLKDRRARKLAWDARRSTTPTPAERGQASSWTKAHLRSQAPPLGLMMSVLAGSRLGATQLGMRGFGEPTTATITAAVPALVALLNSILKKANSSGDAPEKVGGDAASGADVGASGSDDTASGGGIDASGSGKRGGHGAGHADSSLPLGLTKKQLTIGGAVLGGVVLLALLTRK